MPEVIVWLPFKCRVPYLVEVKNPEDIEEIKEKLLELDADAWLEDPNLYEKLGSNFRDFVKEITPEDIDVIDG